VSVNPGDFHPPHRHRPSPRPHPITLLTHDRDIRIIKRDTGQLLRHLTLNPNRDYQPQNAKGD